MNTIVVNQVGYEAGSEKKAVLNFPADVVKVIGKEKQYKEKAVHFGTDDISGEDTYVVDFSDVKESGKYYLEADGVKSASFDINDRPYDVLMHDLCKCYYFLRCGSGLDPKFAGVYRHGKCHNRLAKVYGDEKTLVDVTGGWHDAGDYGRYTTAASVAVAHLLYAIKVTPSLLNLELDIPKSKLPDLLEEIKVELDFIMKMQKEDGGSYHKVTTFCHAAFIMPEDDKDDLWLFPVSSIATADTAAVLALAYSVYKDYDTDYAKKLLEKAKKAYKWLLNNPAPLLFHNPDGSNTGEYDEAEDFSNRFWAAAEMYSVTGETSYKEDILKQKDKLDAFDRELKKKPYHGSVYTCLGWAEVAGLGSLSVLLSKDRDDLYEYLKDCFIKEADRLFENTKKNGYGLCMTKDDFIWGSNMELGKYMMVLTVANKLKPQKKYEDTVRSAINYLLGLNSMDVSYITGNGEKAFKNPHLRPTAVDGIELPWRGLVSGGPNKGLQDEQARNLDKNTPPMKCYLDEVPCYSLNEITIYWNSPVIFALAALIG